jgi:hypothetical protein
MRVLKFLFIDPQIANRQIANPQILLVSQFANCKSQIFHYKTERIKHLFKKIPPFIAKLSKSQLQVCLAV